MFNNIDNPCAACSWSDTARSAELNGGNDNMSAVLVLPRINVEIDGGALPEKSIAALEEVRVQQKLSQPTLCELTFFISRDLLAGVSSVSPGRRLTVTVPPRSAPLFDGEITAVE